MYSGDLADQHRNRDDSPPPMARNGDVFKAKKYGDLRAATPPVMVGGRQVSTGTDIGGRNAGYRRDVSGKVVEEGRSRVGSQSWGARFRKVSGM